MLRIITPPGCFSSPSRMGRVNPAIEIRCDEASARPPASRI
jgi:hypothetical protein